MSAVIINPFNSSAAAPSMDTFDNAHSSNDTISTYNLNATVSPGLLVMCVAWLTGNIAVPTCTVNGQGAATQIATDGTNTGMSLFHYEGNTTDGTQQFDIDFSGNNQDSVSICVWSFSNAVAADILSSDLNQVNNTTNIALTYSGAAGSIVIQETICQDRTQTLAMETGLATIDQSQVQTGNGNGFDHIYKCRRGTGADVTGGTVDGGVGTASDCANMFVEISGT